MGQLLSSLLEIFYTKKLDIVVIGLENRYVRVAVCRTVCSIPFVRSFVLGCRSRNVQLLD
jgi:hypothetical protein